jgi:hypothetical protein
MFGRISPGIAIVLIVSTLITGCIVAVVVFYGAATVDPAKPPAQQEGLIQEQSSPNK